MRTVDMMRAFRQYDERKERLRVAHDNLKFAITAPFWVIYSVQTLTKLIHEVKAAHAAFEDLFVDPQDLVLLELMRQEAKARQEIERFRLEYITGGWSTAREVL